MSKERSRARRADGTDSGETVPSAGKPTSNGASPVASAPLNRSRTPSEPQSWSPTTIVIGAVVFAFFLGLFTGQELLHRPQVVLPPPSAGGSPSVGSSPATDTSSAGTASTDGSAVSGHDDASLKKAIQSETDTSRLMAMGDVLGNQDRPDLGILAYQKAIQLGGGTALAYRQLGLMQWQLNQTDAALQSLRKAEKLSPGDATIHAAIGYVQTTRHDSKGARSEFEAALKLQPSADLKSRIQSALSGLPAS